jgi:Uma2 family endonuclease
VIPFNQYARHDETRMLEWVNGEIELLPELSPAQLKVRDTLLTLLGEYVEESSLGLVIPAPFAVRMPEEMRRGREPDLLYVPHEFVETVQEDYVNSHGVALAVEISDARNRSLDRITKFQEYQTAGIPEYWIVDVDHKESTFYQLTHEGYVVIPLNDAGEYVSRSLRGFRLKPAEIWTRE